MGRKHGKSSKFQSVSWEKLKNHFDVILTTSLLFEHIWISIETTVYKIYHCYIGSKKMFWMLLFWMLSLVIFTVLWSCNLCSNIFLLCILCNCWAYSDLNIVSLRRPVLIMMCCCSRDVCMTALVSACYLQCYNLSVTKTHTLCRCAGWVDTLDNRYTFIDHTLLGGISILC